MFMWAGFFYLLFKLFFIMKARFFNMILFFSLFGIGHAQISGTVFLVNNDIKPKDANESMVSEVVVTKIIYLTNNII